MIEGNMEEKDIVININEHAIVDRLSKNILILRVG